MSHPSARKGWFTPYAPTRPVRVPSHSSYRQLSYEVDFNARVVTYYGAGDESYTESYPSVEVPA
jgi:hypothetical protein